LVYSNLNSNFADHLQKMLLINLKENDSIDKALKKYKKKFEKTGVIKELRDRQQFTKPSVKRRKLVIKARYKQSLNNPKQ
jgi:small subunit ribosomal protein S21